MTDFVYDLIIFHSSEKDPFLNCSIKRTFFLLLTADKIGASFEKVGDTFLNLLSWKVDYLF
ncbi:MAG: hypothetical protein ACRD8Z_22885, partial [Nitrososphaeraceae archaeon]